MKKEICALVLAALVLAALVLPAPPAARAADGDAQGPLASVLKREGYTVSLDLRVRRQKRDSLQRFLEIFEGETPPNAYATGFVVGEGLVVTSYHAVSGGLDAAHRRRLGFAPDDALAVEAFVNGCEAEVVKADGDADLALLRVCRTKRPAALTFQDAPGRDDELLVIARPNGVKAVRRGPFSGTYTYRGRQYWAAKIEGRDGFSGSPVYNGRGEIVGVFSGYDSAQKVALISPGAGVQKLLADYASAAPKP